MLLQQAAELLETGQQDAPHQLGALRGKVSLHSTCTTVGSLQDTHRHTCKNSYTYIHVQGQWTNVAKWLSS